MAERTLTRRELNRALLARQHLLERSPMSVMEMTAHLVGLQAQVPNPPYIGLWTRLAAFERDDLTQLMEGRQIVRVPMMRSTLMLMTAADYQHFRTTLQPALTRALSSFYGARGRGLPIDRLVAAAKPFLEEAPRTTGELRMLLEDLEPQRAGDAMAYAVRNFLPLVQVPPGGTWGSGNRAAYTTAERYLGSVAEEDDLRGLFLRYLAAFGPASVMDFQFWAGMTKLKSALEALKPELRVYRDEAGKELYDLPDAPLPDADIPAPVRFMPPFDNLIISHADRSRVISEDAYKQVFLSAARVMPTILVDGVVAGRWNTERDSAAATLRVEAFQPFDPQTETALIAEGERLLRFAEDDAQTFTVEITEVR